MIKHVLAATAALATVAAFSAPAFAATSGSTVTVTGSVAPQCSVANSTSTAPLGALTVDANGKLVSQNQTFHFGDIWCNATGNSIAVTAHPMTNPNTTTDTASFTSRVDFNVTSSNPGLAGLTASSSDEATQTRSGLPAFDTGVTTYDQYTVTTVANASKKPVAGDYTGSINVVVTPGS